ncbi:thiol-disulfide oxidoreductase DCC family protein [Guptibacillus algicola]|uniref:thiol-disulfide oxidoreductase DCC family protein n=1 Tax=Guptibacillus algicola TaxID=225844 RepID=UPI001CD700CF|nr:DCC1-like thiol-disulfide oxidoreductase family protein [Alkalihalobacillus algicola]MCA0988300.1 DCC1-like thiol-disulfide oxidoreductase family protein [Alkalihalobacillus algicola]
MERRSNIILFDGVCNLCNGFVQFMLKHDKNHVFHFASLQSNAANKLLNELQVHDLSDSIVVIEDGQVLVKSQAVLYICKKLGGRFNLLRIGLILPHFIRDFIYDLIAKRRYLLFGKKESCMLPNPKYKKRFLE